MTIGFVTLLVPAIQGGDGRHTSKNEFTLSEDDISLISKCFFKSKFSEISTFMVDHVFMLHSWVYSWYGVSNTIVRAN